MQYTYINFMSHIISSTKMSTFPQEPKKLTMYVDSGDHKTTSEPVGKREMLASDYEENTLAMDTDQEPTAPEPMGEREMSGSGQEQNKLIMDVDSGDQQKPASESVGKRYVKNSLAIVTVLQRSRQLK